MGNESIAVTGFRVGTPRRTAGWADRLRSTGRAFGVLLAAAVFWELGSRALGSLYIPPLSAVLVHIYENWLSGPAYRLWVSDTLLEIVGPSLGRLVPAFLIATAAAILLGTAIGLVRVVRDTVYPVVHFLRAIPSAAKVPLFVVLLGIGDNMKMWVIGVAVAFPIIINTVDGVRSVEPTLLDVCKVHRVSATRRILGVVLPAATPQIFAGVRVATAAAFIVMIVVEMLAASDGIGYFILYGQRQFRYFDMWAGLLLLAVLGYLLNIGLNLLERWLLSWHRAQRATSH